eukprot:696339-Amphidinium_carterae.3
MFLHEDDIGVTSTLMPRGDLLLSRGPTVGVEGDNLPGGSRMTACRRVCPVKPDWCGPGVYASPNRTPFGELASRKNIAAPATIQHQQKAARRQENNIDPLEGVRDPPPTKLTPGNVGEGPAVILKAWWNRLGPFVSAGQKCSWRNQTHKGLSVRQAPLTTGL